MFFNLVPNFLKDTKKDYTIIPTYINPAILLFIFIFLTRILFMVLSTHSHPDVDTFSYWAYRLSNDGLKNFYYGDFFKDYPPLYMYVLYIIGNIANALKFEVYSVEYINLIKSFTFIFDALTCVFIYKICTDKFKLSVNNSFLLALLYGLNPAVIHNSAVWGQVDAINAFICVASLYYLTSKKYTVAYCLYVLAILNKPHSLIIGPIYLVSVINYFRDLDKKQDFIKFFFKYFFICIGIVILVYLPFVNGWDFSVFIDTYKSTLTQYPYATLNAFNFHAIFGGNFVDVNDTMFIISYATFGWIMICIATVLSIVFLLKNRTAQGIFFIAGFLNTWTFMFAHKMHERYLFISLIFFFMSYLYSKRKGSLILYIGFTITQYINTTDVLRMVVMDNDASIIKYSIAVIPYVNLILVGLMVYEYISLLKNPIELSPWEEVDKNDKYISKFFTYKVLEPIKSVRLPKLQKRDYIFMLILTGLYSCFTIFNIGQMYNPQTNWTGNAGDSVTFTFDENTDIDKIAVFLGSKNSKEIELEVNDITTPMTLTSVFKWVYEDIDQNTNEVTIYIPEDDTRIMEIGFLDSNNQVIGISNVTSNTDPSTLIDEQMFIPNGYSKVGNIYTGKSIEYPNDSNYMNSTYFDEIYHPRTAYEIVNGLDIYEITHPPLGKDIMAFFVSIFGMTPFAYRIGGVLFGIAMIPIMYLLAFYIFKDSKWAMFSALLMTFDFMHHTQTRIGTIDSYLTVFIMLSYLFMFKYYSMNIYEDKLEKSYIPLLFSGIFMGLAMATKWSGVYSAVGLAIIFFATIYHRYGEYLWYYKNENIEMISLARKYLVKIILVCFIFFVAIPVIIYFGSYIPYMRGSNFNSFSDIIGNQFYMLNYHGHLESTHPFESSWWMWPLNIRPMYYYAKTYGENIVGGISAFGNPAIWWMGIVALFYGFYKINGKDKHILFFIIVAYFAQYLPWIFISRTVYMYHYFPSTPFIILLITFMFKDRFKEINNKWVIIYLAIVVILFILFYPVITGIPVNSIYVDKVLRWFPSWVLTP